MSGVSQCPVCLESFDSKVHKPLALPCGHVFCQSCLMQLNSVGRKLCPECRASWKTQQTGNLTTIFCLIPKLATTFIQEAVGVKVTQIIIKNITGSSIEIDVSGSGETVKSLQQKIQDVLGLPADAQYLLYGGQQLQAGKKLSDYKIKQLSTVYLVCRLRGGCKTN